MEICKTQLNSIFYPTKMILVKPLKTPQFAPLIHSQSNKPCPLSITNSISQQSSPPLKFTKKTTLFADNYSGKKLEKGSVNPLQLLQDDGDWSNAQFWDVVKFLQQSSRFHDVLEVFNTWTKLDISRINEQNYNKIIRLLCESRMMCEASLQLENMKNYNLRLSSDIYNSIIHGYAQEGKFSDALRYLNEMEETNVNPDTETYDGLIKGYGKFEMYDEMMQCLKRMENYGCLPDHVTYNLLIQELSKGRLLNRMERTYHTIISKRMNLQSSTLVAILEAYTDYGVMDKMEFFYMKVRKTKIVLKERMVRKIARVYVENHVFTRLEDLANDVCIRMGKTNLFWCLRLLSHGCQLSKKGMNDVIREMEEEKVPWNVTVVNIISFAFLKMKNFKQLDMTFSELPYRRVKPDLVTFGVLYDAHEVGFEWSKTMKVWRKRGYLENGVDLNMDPLVFAILGKGIFLRTVEEASSFLDPKLREEKLWTYDTLFKFVVTYHVASSPSLVHHAQSELTSNK